MNKQRWSGKVENVGQICYGHFLTTFISCGQNNVVVVVVDLSVHEPLVWSLSGSGTCM